MSGLDRMAFNILTPRTPNREWSANVGIPGIECSLSTPECQYRTRYTSSCRPIRFVVLAVERRGGSILFADGVYMDGISKSFDVRCANVRRKHARACAPTRERAVDDGLICCGQYAFWKRFRLR